MMVGSILWNCWAALIGFSIYFFMTFQSPKTPTTILTNSFIIAVVIFLVVFLVRFVIAFVFFTPQSEAAASEETALTEDGQIKNIQQTNEQLAVQTNNNKIEETAEEVAKAVQSMMLEDIK
ncbi:hypothetical protein JFL43_05730 [Viridibacillus sp. YIM B01967]|uniref:Uncharacterized protein n=1 Tax=Viridibacillus soli TaxID=2798301 RepID=A0ABS1H4M2_9BACL|nr:hypothetical protein [Viridibacillus soli]MBK3494365.1 hypothetical protein [Viridibacillus soli]